MRGVVYAWTPVFPLPASARRAAHRLTTEGRKNVASNPPIYDQLVREHGDVVTEAREAADLTSRQARDALDWSGLRSHHSRAWAGKDALSSE
ncbi:hypothetical protein GCM10009654_54790 [Streptomyces hebeiensis]|uniref:Uncharacterized protein n=1 Tax=Streptomyces hebeiensis TaxID=229486 RepID=A0ABN1V1T2_9ACTN